MKQLKGNNKIDEEEWEKPLNIYIFFVQNYSDVFVYEEMLIIFLNQL